MIIPVTPENENAWAQLCTALWPSHMASSMLEERKAGSLQDEYLYTLDGALVAFISLSTRTDYVQGTDTSPVGYIEGIYVMPEYRGRGIARELVGFAKKWSADKGCTQLASDCWLENDTSRKFHNRTGFTEAGTILCFTMDL